MHRSSRRLCVLVVLLVVGLSGWTHAQSKRRNQKILIETSKPYDKVVNAIKARGGKVSYEYKYVDGIAAEVPEDAIEDIRTIAGTSDLDKDIDVPRPAALGTTHVRSQQAAKPTMVRATRGPRVTSLASFANSHPEAYSLNNAGTRIDKVHAKGFTGQGVIVAVIDSGIRPGFSLVNSASIVGGTDFVDDGPAGPAGDSDTDWKKDSNEGHGTFSAGLIAGNGTFSITADLKSAIQMYAPSALVDDKLPLVGTAPDAKLYIVRIFGDDPQTGASKSTVIAAIQHVIDQRQLYDQTKGRQGVNIQVANLSFGVNTLFAGHTLMEQSIDALLKAGIVPVIAAGNTGPSTLTVANPSSSLSGISVGSISRAANERIGIEMGWADYPGVGGDVRPFDGVQVAYFSSRGPNADGRLSPDVVTSGVSNISQGYCPDQTFSPDACAGEISIASGSSFSAPIVSGIAAALRQAFPKATATQIRNAIIASGRPGQVENFFDVLDRGQGVPDAWGAYQALNSGNVDDSLPRFDRPDDLVRRNIEQGTKLDVSSGFISKTFKKLKAGERAEILYDVPKGTDRVVVKIKNVALNGPQNAYFGGDTLWLYAHTAKTSAIGAFGDYLIGDPFFGGEDETVYNFDDPDTGIMRITLNPDTWNAGTANAEVSVEAIHEPWPRATFSDTVRDGKTKKFVTEVKSGTTRMDLLLTWEHDWAHYPTNDLDLIVCSPDITTVDDCKANGNKDGATLAGPERVSIANPVAGNWMILVSGFNVFTGSDDFKVRVTKTKP